MAGEAQQSPTTYNDISSGKVVNKEGLLELCCQIKASIANAGGSGGSNSSQQPEYIVVLPGNFNLEGRVGTSSPTIPIDENYQSLFQAYFDEMIADPFKAQRKYLTYMTDNNTGLMNQVIPYSRTFIDNNPYNVYRMVWIEIPNIYYSLTTRSSYVERSYRWRGIAFNAVSTKSVDCEISWNTRQYNDSNDEIIKSGSFSTKYAFGITTGYLQNTNTLIQDLQGLAQKSLPTSSSTDGTYMLVDTVSNGTSTKSWETVPSGGGGGGATYTAGTGIDIDANNEISVDTTDLSYNDLQDKPTIPTVPTNISSFTNDAGYLTSHQSLTGYATQNYVDNALSQVPSYSAGTGISINANGVISLDLQNANGVSY